MSIFEKYGAFKVDYINPKSGFQVTLLTLKVDYINPQIRIQVTLFTLKVDYITP